ncbi:MAG: spermine synthase, partial [Pseudomonadota bacterium]
VELRSQVVEAAHTHFGLPQDPRLKISIGCGAKHVQQLQQQLQQQQARSKDRYDVILVDAYRGSGMAPEVSSEEFFRHCHALLGESGILVINLWRYDKALLSEVTRNLVSAFDWRVHFIPVKDASNLIGFAVAKDFPRVALKKLEIEARKLQQHLKLDFPVYLHDLTVSDPLQSLFIDE